MCSPHTATYSDNNALSNSLRNYLFVDGFNSSPGWLLVTWTRGAWWCRYRGHCRSGPRHLSPRSRVCAQEWHWKDIHSHIHSHTPMHTPKKMQKQQQQNAQLTKHDAFVYWSSSCAVCWWPIFRKLGTCSTTDALSPRTLLTENMCESVQQILQHCPAWWCRYRGHCRWGPRHLSPRSRVCAQKWHSKDIHSQIHSHTPMHTPQKQNPSNHETWLRLLVLFLSSVLVGHGQELSFADASQAFSTLEAFSPWTVMTENRCVENK